MQREFCWGVLSAELVVIELRGDCFEVGCLQQVVSPGEGLVWYRRDSHSLGRVVGGRRRRVGTYAAGREFRWRVLAIVVLIVVTVARIPGGLLWDDLVIGSVRLIFGGNR